MMHLSITELRSLLPAIVMTASFYLVIENLGRLFGHLGIAIGCRLFLLVLLLMSYRVKTTLTLHNLSRGTVHIVERFNCFIPMVAAVSALVCVTFIMLFLLRLTASMMVYCLVWLILDVILFLEEWDEIQWLLERETDLTTDSQANLSQYRDRQSLLSRSLRQCLTALLKRFYTRNKNQSDETRRIEIDV